MSKRDTLGYQAQLLRKKAQRRIARLEAVIESESTPKRVRARAESQVREMREAMESTRQRSATGKRYTDRTQTQIREGVSRLEESLKGVAARQKVYESNLEVTQHELNRASVGAASVYTKEEAKIFYRATQKIWQREGIGEHDRNIAILDHYNSIRKENGLSPLTLDQIVDYVLEANRDLKEQQSVSPQEPMTPEQEEFYKQAQRTDSEDHEKGSPTDAQIAVGIRDALQDLLVLPENLFAGAIEISDAQDMIDFLNSMV